MTGEKFRILVQDAKITDEVVLEGLWQLLKEKQQDLQLNSSVVVQRQFQEIFKILKSSHRKALYQFIKELFETAGMAVLTVEKEEDMEVWEEG